jgi:hypothetical protein
MHGDHLFIPEYSCAGIHIDTKPRKAQWKDMWSPYMRGYKMSPRKAQKHKKYSGKSKEIRISVAD